MLEVYKNLFIGDILDYENYRNDTDFKILSACKNPCHKEMCGYSKDLDKNSVDYFYKENDRQLALNIVDGAKNTFSLILFTKAFEFIDKHLAFGNKVLVHCNKGESRSATIVLLYLIRIGYMPSDMNIAGSVFKTRYNGYNPSFGIQEFAIDNFNILME